jgi:hypothetical protein
MMSRDRLLHPSFDAKPQSVGHLPSFRGPQIPDGFALCVACWQMITACQLGFERCCGHDPNTLQPVLDALPPQPQQ